MTTAFAGIMRGLVLTGLFLASSGVEAAEFALTTVDGRRAWVLTGAESPVEIEVVIPFYETLVPLARQLPLLLTDAPFRRKVVLQPGVVVTDPRHFLPTLTDQEKVSYASPDPKRQFPGWRLLGHYLLLRKADDGGVSILAEGNRSFSYRPDTVPVRSGDILLLVEVDGD
jgi:hypothetical protein